MDNCGIAYGDNFNLSQSDTKIVNCQFSIVHSYAAASSIFSIKMPYPIVGSLTRTCVTAPTSFPVAVPGVRLADGAAALHTDRCHSLSSLYLPPAALASLPILNNRRAGHLCVKHRTKFYTILFSICSKFYIVFLINNAPGENPEALHLFK